jgi:hypothetical protein
MGGAAENLGIEALAGDTDMVTVFDDFNHIMPNAPLPTVPTSDAATNAWTDCGWVISDAGATTTPVAGYIGMNNPATVTNDYSSCIKIYGGTADDEGGNFQLDLIAADLASAANNLTALSGRYNFPHMWIPETAAIQEGGLLAGDTANTALDGTTWMFACRVGFRSDDNATTGAGNWDSNTFIGFAKTAEAAVMTPTTGVISVAAADDVLVGFHIPLDGSIDGISQRVGNTAYAAGTNFTELRPAGSVDNTVANLCDVVGQTVWYDLAFRMDIIDMSDVANNGTTQFYWRRVLPGMQLGDWNRHTTVLTNQTPNSATSLVPTIEHLNGLLADADSAILLDWWCFGRSRVNR